MVAKEWSEDVLHKKNVKLLPNARILKEYPALNGIYTNQFAETISESSAVSFTYYVHEKN